MSSRNRNILIGIGAGVALIIVALAAFLLGRNSSDDRTVTAATTTVTTTKTVTAARTASTKTASDTTNTSQSSPATSHGPYFTMDSAVNYVESLEGGMMAISPGTTWQTGATLHVVRATPTGGASYGGDFYYFFVDGYPVAEYDFTSAQSDQAIDDTTFAVTFNVYLPEDPHCCPTGGMSTVQFYWDGSSVMASGSMQGATM